MRVIAFMLMLFGMASVACADVVYTIDPLQGQNGQVVNLRIDETDFQCFPASAPELVRVGTFVRVRFDIEDSSPPGPCPATWVTPRFHSLGTFTTGHYVVEVTTCSNPPMGPPCTVQATMDLSVFGSNGQRFTVPAASWPVLFLLAMALGVAGIRPRRQ